MIELVKEVAFLGVILDEHFSWKPHTSEVARKISKSIVSYTKLVFPFQSLPYNNHSVYCVQNLQYCLIIWGPMQQI